MKLEICIVQSDTVGKLEWYMIGVTITNYYGYRLTYT